MFFERTASVARLSPTPNDNNKEQYASATPIYLNIPINIQPATAELTAIVDGVYGRTYRAFVTVSGIELGDLITVSGTGKSFTVKGVADWNYAPIPHVELTLWEGDA